MSLLSIFFRKQKQPTVSRRIQAIETPYTGISEEDYQIEKRRLQVELIYIQQKVIKQNLKLAIVLEGRDAAGKGSTIKRLVENLASAQYRIATFKIPTAKESRQWFPRYKKNLPELGEVVFFDRSWYSRALVEPTMGYCTESQYRQFMNKVLKWEYRQINSGVILVKFYLSIDEDTQLHRFEDRLNSPLTFWKFSNNDLQARKRWEVFTHYKEQMFARCSSDKSPWIVINANKKREARLTVMLHLVRMLGHKKFKPLVKENPSDTHSIELFGVDFNQLSTKQLKVLRGIKEQQHSPKK